VRLNPLAPNGAFRRPTNTKEPITVKSTVNTVLRRVRLAHGMTQRELASAVGASQPTIHRLERGLQRGARPRTVVRLERVLGVPLDVLLLPDHTNGAAPKDDAAGTARPRTVKNAEES
jgi:transcriptional regulator with XRE-family HTH domain